jgi:hypothetical protein
MHLIRSLAFALCLGLGFTMGVFQPARAQVTFSVTIDVEPPPLPVYEQPPIPEPGYIWVPGYWAWSDDFGYYWVPGTWVLPPEPGLLWTPGYWAWSDGVYGFYPGYWGPEVGYYGGVYYGYGYTGEGYEGGYWRDGRFFYNTTVNNFGGVQVVNVYTKTVIVTNTTNVSYNGGAGGTTARPTAEQLAVAHERHIPPSPTQLHHVEEAAKDPTLSLAHNHGHPAVAATAHPGELKGPGVIAARPGPPVPVRPAKVVPPEGRATAVPGGQGKQMPEEHKGPLPGATTGPAPKETKPPTPEPAPAAGEKKPPAAEVKPETPKPVTPTAPPHPTPPPPQPQAAHPAPPHPTPPPPQPQTARPAPPPPHAPPPPRPAPAAKPKCQPGERCQ